jgi:hypothetical protein
MEFPKKKEQEKLKKILNKAQEEAHLERISLDDHGDTIVGNRLKRPNFEFEELEEKKLPED